MKLNLLPFILTLFISILLNSQDTTLPKNDVALASKDNVKISKKDFRIIEDLIDKENYLEAKNKGLSILESHPDNPRANYLTGLSYLLSNHLNERAIYYLKSSLINSKGKDTILEAVYYLSKAYYKSEDFKKAKKMADIFNYSGNIRSSLGGNELKKEYERLKVLIDNAVGNLKNAKKYLNVTNLKGDINTFNDEYSPVFKPGEEDFFVYTALNSNAERRALYKKNKNMQYRLARERIVLAKKYKNGNWYQNDSLSTYLKENLNEEYNNDAPVYFTKSSKKFFFLRNGTLYILDYKDGKWQEPKIFSKELNKRSRFKAPVLIESSEKNQFYLSTTTKKDSKGGSDIYLLSLDDKDKFISLKNLGNTINTDKDEDSPFLSKDGKTLYFSSKGHNSMGDYDVFKSTKNGDEWSKPINMGTPINSVGDDRYIIIDDQEKYGYISSDRSSGIGGMDIYKIHPKNISPNCIIKGIIYDKTSNKPLKAEITFIDLDTKKVVTTVLTSADNGLFNIKIPRKNGIMDILTEEGYTQRIPIKIPLEEENPELFMEIELESVMNNNELSKVANVRSSFYEAEHTIKRFEQEDTLNPSNMKNKPPQIEKLSLSEKKIIILSRFKDANPELYNIDYYAYQRLKMNKIDLDNSTDLLVSFIDSELLRDDYYSYIQLVSNNEIITKKIKKNQQLKLPILDTRKEYNIKLVTKDGYYAEETINFRKNNTISSTNNVLIQFNLNDIADPSKVKKYLHTHYYFFKSDKYIHDFDSTSVIDEAGIKAYIKKQKNAAESEEKRKILLSKNDSELAKIEKILNPKKYASNQIKTKKIIAYSEFKNVLFAFNSYKVNEKTKKLILKVVDYMKNNKSTKIEITGHTDSKGSKAYNKILSKKRAESVMNELIKGGIDKSRIKMLYEGESNPLVPNKDKNGNDLKENRQLNRRVSFIQTNF